MHHMFLRSRKGKVDKVEKRGTRSQTKKDSIAPITPQKGEKSVKLDLVDLSDELIAQIVHHLSEVDCISFSLANHKINHVVNSAQDHWRKLFLGKFGSSNQISAPLVLDQAAVLANGWQKLFSAKQTLCNQRPDFGQATPFEIEASVQLMFQQVLQCPSQSSKASKPAATASSSSTATSAHVEDVAIFFLVDGSGSVSDNEFREMQSFIVKVVDLLLTKSKNLSTATTATAHKGASSSTAASSSMRKDKSPKTASLSRPGIIRVGLIQFSSDYRLEFPLTAINNHNNNNGFVKFENAVDNVRRMNGGTSVAPAIGYAGSLFQKHAKESKKIMCIITDGQFDPYQSKEAARLALQLDNEDAHGVNIHVFGIGRGADKQEIMRIIQATRGMCDESDAALRYLPVIMSEDMMWS